MSLDCAASHNPSLLLAFGRPRALNMTSPLLRKSLGCLAKQTSTRLGLGPSSIRPSRGLATVVEPLLRDPVELDQITTLPNGLRVATEILPGHFAGIGVYVEAGSRYETQNLRGVSHIMDRMAFKSTKSRSTDSMLEALETLGGNVQCASSRESIMYQMATFNDAVPTAVGLLAETIRDPLITEEELTGQLQTAEYEIGEIWSKPELILPELVHVAAYKDNTLGNPLLCPEDRLRSIDRTTLQTYRDIFYQPERMVIAFAGVQHQDALRLVEKHFGDMKSSSSPIDDPAIQRDNSDFALDPTNHTIVKPSHTAYPTPPPSPKKSRLLQKIPFLKNLSTSASNHANVLSQQLSPNGELPVDLHAVSHYTGGFMSLPPLPPPVNPALPCLSYIHLAFEAAPISSPDIYAMATLQTLLGGGGSFSAGGPGKGMYSRLYTNVLNQYGWVESCVAFNHSYTDSGLFGISASCAPARVGQMTEVLCRELHALTLDSGYSALQQAEVSRAKNQLRSSLLMNLESRMVGLEDLGRQVQVHGKKTSVREMCQKIEEVTITELRRVAKQVFTGTLQNAGRGTGKPTVVLQEGLEDQNKRKPMPWEDLESRISRWKLGRR